MRLFRVVRRNPPTEKDFLSPAAKGRKPLTPEQERTYQCVSAFTTLEQARDKAVQLKLGEFVAELDVPDDSPCIRDEGGHVDLEKTTPGQLLRSVVQVHGVEARVET